METIEAKPEILTPRKIRARKVANGIIEGKSYTEIGEEVSPNAKYPRQTIYETLQTDHVQSELRDILSKVNVELLNPKVITAKIADLAFNSSSEAIQTKNLETLAKIYAMLTEKREISTPGQFTKSEDFAKLPLNEMISVIEARLKLNSQGVNTSQEKPEKV